MRTTHLTPSTFFKLSLISLSLILAACNQQEVPKTTASEPKKIELIPQDLIPVKKAHSPLKPLLQELFVQYNKVLFKPKLVQQQLPLQPM